MTLLGKMVLNLAEEKCLQVLLLFMGNSFGENGLHYTDSSIHPTALTIWFDL
jgi:hypothetical protein